MTTSITELRARANMPVTKAGGSTVSAFFEANKAAISAVLPKHVGPERLMKLAMGAIRQIPKLQECTVTSLFGAAIQCAQLGLEPNTVMGECYILPFRNRKEKRTDVQVIIGYRGMLNLARRSGQIVSISAHEVRENDDFEWAYGLDEKLHHVPADGDRGAVKYFYAVAKLVGGGHSFEVMTDMDVRSIMLNTQSKGEYGPWRDHYVEMGRKTVTRKMFKWLPCSIELATAVAMDEVAERGADQGMEKVLEGSWEPVNEQEEDQKEDASTGNADPDKENPPQTIKAEAWPKKFIDQETGEEGWTDQDDTIFDPAKHGTKPDGTPAMTPTGNKFRKRRASKGEKRTETKAPSHAKDDHQQEQEDEGGDDTQDSDDPFGGME